MRNAGPHRAERELQMLEVVAGQDRDRPLGRQPAIEQRLADRAGALEHLRIADADPRAVGAAPRDQPAVRCACAPLTSRSVSRRGYAPSALAARKVQQPSRCAISGGAVPIAGG
jgi:hypothetical protein